MQSKLPKLLPILFNFVSYEFYVQMDAPAHLPSPSLDKTCEFGIFVWNRNKGIKEIFRFSTVTSAAHVPSDAGMERWNL